MDAWNAQQAFTRLGSRLDTVESQLLNARDRELEQAKTIAQMAQLMAVMHEELLALGSLSSEERRGMSPNLLWPVNTDHSVRFDNQPPLYHGPG
jgi:hypothetical protein